MRSGGGPAGSRGRPERPEPEVAGPKSWGSLGRRGAGRLAENKIDARNAIGAVGRDERPDPGHELIRWERVDDTSAQAKGAVARGRAGKPQTRERPNGRADERPRAGAEAARTSSERRGRAPRPAGAGSGGAVAKDELARALGGPRGARANERLRDAAHAFERERYEEARSLLKPVAVSAPQATSVRELLGLTYYRLGKWSDAVRELEAFREQSGTAEQHPVLADSYRALKRYTEVETLWDELREASPSGALVTEGRIVMAGSLADRRKIGEAIVLLERSHRSVKRAQTHHLRQAYALADLYERAGDVSRARELFWWIVGNDADFADAAERASALA